MFTDAFLDSLPDDPLEAALAMCQYVLESCEKAQRAGEEIQTMELMEAYIAFTAFAETHSIYFSLLEESQEMSVRHLIDFFSAERNILLGGLIKENNVRLKERYLIRFGGTFYYEFSNGDLKRIQNLINELRNHIASSKLFDEKHRMRLIKKLEDLQQEMHKKIGSLDKFWGLLGEAGVVIKKFGEDAKPIVDRIKEITDIVWRTQARAEELPSGESNPLLTSGDKDQS